jgi:electron transport complex protein RnfC
MPMLKIHYSLESDLKKDIVDIPAPDEINIRVSNLVLKTGKGKKIAKGELIAEHPSRFGGAYHAPVSGKVTKVNYHHITIKSDGTDNCVEPVDLSSLETGKELLRTLQGLGVDVAPLSSASRLLIINGLNPEPGISVTEQLLRDELKTIEAGLEMARRFIAPEQTVLAVSAGSPYRLDGAEIKQIKPKYPNSLDALVAKKVTGKEFPEETRIMSVVDLYRIGKIVLSGLPITDTTITVGDTNYHIPLGTPIRHLVEYLGLEVSSGDKVVLGGPFRGEAVYSLSEGVKKADHGLFVVKAGSFPAIEDATCINCGECVLNCPARIQANLISRYAEFEMFDHAVRHGLHSCLECGLCSFNCTARRPLLQYIRFAKTQLMNQGAGEQEQG